MQLAVKPLPSEKFYKLSAKEMSHVAWTVAKRYGENGQPDITIFRDWTRAWATRNRSKQLTLA